MRDDLLACYERELTFLRQMGAEIAETESGFVVHGPSRLRGVRCQSWGDHRIAMSLAIAALIAEGETEIADADCIDASYPGFVSTLRGLLSNEFVRTKPKGKSGHRADWPSNQP